MLHLSVFTWSLVFARTHHSRKRLLSARTGHGGLAGFAWRNPEKTVHGEGNGGPWSFFFQVVMCTFVSSVMFYAEVVHVLRASDSLYLVLSLFPQVPKIFSHRVPVELLHRCVAGPPFLSSSPYACRGSPVIQCRLSLSSDVNVRFVNNCMAV